MTSNGSFSSHPITSSRGSTSLSLSSLIFFYLYLLLSSLLLAKVKSLSSPSIIISSPKFVILGGTGKIGTAVAAHLIKRSPSCEVVLVGRRSSTAEKALQDIKQALRDSSISNPSVSFEQVEDIWNVSNSSKLNRIFQNADGIIHTAGPYAEKTPTVLEAAIQAKVPVYVDVSDPLPFLQQSLDLSERAKASQTTALCAAGAFPGMSNVLAMEAAAGLQKDNPNAKIQDVRFNYFTKGLGGSGTINLYITNIGFGDPMTQHDNGQRRAFTELSGTLLGSVDFFIKDGLESSRDNQHAKQRVGTINQVFAWPFPEAATVASHLGIRGSSSAAMGTAPDLWNTMLGVLVDIVPRNWWRNPKFSQFMADFSQPLVLATDAWLQKTSPDQVGETHAMRIDVAGTSIDASRTSTDRGGDNENNPLQQQPQQQQQQQQPMKMVSIVQAHDSFRQCVGQSCAEFALDLLEHPSPGVYLPEQFYDAPEHRRRIIEKLTRTPGNFCYTGPVSIGNIDNDLPVYPANVQKAVDLAKQTEQTSRLHWPST